ncbi:MAG: energy transducer TonB [Deltaproteobacteria bacterium]|nr:energy transducer TonB [Deltaproteobacteria bacterium]MBN2670363.1 energy transducer TonB [Deltaproteobacteria bacterium]
MKPNAHNAELSAGRVDYAAERAMKREAAALRLSARVRRPVSVHAVTAVPKKRFRSSLWGMSTVGLALLFHASVVTALVALEDDRPEEAQMEKAVFQVVEKIAEPLPPEPEPESEVVESEVVESEAVESEVVESEAVQQVVAEPEQQKQTPVKRVKVARTDPVNAADSSAPVEPKRRAVVGITMSSTVTGGGGPSYAVGNTRMGATGSVQSDEKIEKLQKGKTSGPGGEGAGKTVSANRQATFIPTVSSSFTKPKRISSVELPYPAALKSKGIEGNVMVLIVIDEAGRVQKVRILKSSGYREFDEAALQAARKEVYSPAFRDGKAVEYNLKYTYRFRMKGA